jgi:hypothetical protein
MFGTWFFGDPCMKLVTTLATMAALVSLGGCNRAPSSGQSASAEKANSQPAHSAGPNTIQASATGLPAHSAGPNGQGLEGNPNAIPASSTLTPVVDRAFLIGRWTDGRDCHEAGQFSADGRYTNTAGQNAGWTLESDQLTLTFDGAAPRILRVSAGDQNTLNVINPDGTTGRSTRC